jgi:hypothetical protein
MPKAIGPKALTLQEAGTSGVKMNVYKKEGKKMVNSVPQTTLLSHTAPTWMNEPYENNAKVLKQRGMGKVLQQKRGSKVAFADAERRGANNRGGVVYEDGKVNNMSIVSIEQPDWVKSPFENNRHFFESKGIAQKLVDPSEVNFQAAGVTCRKKYDAYPSRTGFGSKKAPDWMTRVDDEHMYQRNKHGISKETGERFAKEMDRAGHRGPAPLTKTEGEKAHNAQPLSLGHKPKFMESPMLSYPSRYNQHAAEKDKDDGTAGLEQTGVNRHKIKQAQGMGGRRNIISAKAPEWMSSTVEANRAHFATMGKSDTEPGGLMRQLLVDIARLDHVNEAENLRKNVTTSKNRRGYAPGCKMDYPSREAPEWLTQSTIDPYKPKDWEQKWDFHPPPRDANSKRQSNNDVKSSLAYSGVANQGKIFSAGKRRLRMAMPCRSRPATAPQNRRSRESGCAVTPGGTRIKGYPTTMVPTPH